jgi:hypothetical protein
MQKTITISSQPIFTKLPLEIGSKLETLEIRGGESALYEFAFRAAENVAKGFPNHIDFLHEARPLHRTGNRDAITSFCEIHRARLMGALLNGMRDAPAQAQSFLAAYCVLAPSGAEAAASSAWHARCATSIFRLQRANARRHSFRHTSPPMMPEDLLPQISILDTLIADCDEVVVSAKDGPR